MSNLSSDELDTARQELIKYSQRLHFKEDLKSLTGEGKLDKASQLLQLHAFLDKDGILRVGGCL